MITKKYFDFINFQKVLCETILFFVHVFLVLNKILQN